MQARSKLFKKEREEGMSDEEGIGMTKRNLNRTTWIHLLQHTEFSNEGWHCSLCD